jgi:hypothetical protein
MRLTVVNVSSSISSAEFHSVVRAIARQVNEDFTPEWSIVATLRSATSTLKNRKVPIEGRHNAIIYVGDSSQDPTTGVTGALGYHSDNHANIPYGFVYLDICKEYGESWSCTLSHEVMELLADPTAVLTVTGPDPKNPKRSVYFDLEVCDPTQGDTYEIDNVTVSNFVTRAYFGMQGGSSATNFLKLTLQPFGVRPRGYFQYEDAKGGTHQIEGKIAEGAAARRRAARALLKSGRRNTRRAERSR